MGNLLFSAAAALAYSYDHDLRFSMPSETTNNYWKPVYLKHLVHPEFDPNLPKIVIEEQGFPFKPLPFDPAWAEDHIIVVDGYRQSEMYFAHHREKVLDAFGFPWKPLAGWTSVHIRLGDYKKHVDKHPAVSQKWYEAQMAKFPGSRFAFFSDEIEFCEKAFGHRDDCFFDLHVEGLNDPREEVSDLVAGSYCENHICSASTFSLWQALLNRNPNKRCIVPKEWICEGWSGTTAKDWADVVPIGPGWERA